MYPIIEQGSLFFYNTHDEYKHHHDIIYTFDALNYLNTDVLLKTCRPVLTLHWDNKNFILNYLFWFVDTNLASIDNKVISNSYQDDDFMYAIKTDFYPSFDCLHCGANHQNLLMVDINPLYPNNFSLADKKRQYITDNHLFKKCKKCHKNFNHMVLHMF